MASGMRSSTNDPTTFVTKLVDHEHRDTIFHFVPSLTIFSGPLSGSVLGECIAVVT